MLTLDLVQFLSFTFINDQRYKEMMAENARLVQQNSVLQMQLSEVLRKRMKDEPEAEKSKVDQVSQIIVIIS